ncbi:MAG: carboxymuconolactone decarboxylase family protein [Candidatus Omnitrophota bacterium]
MKHLNVLSYEQADPETQTILKKIKEQLGRVPNIYGALAHSSHALGALLSFKKALTGGVLNEKEAEAIALVVAGDNSCEYCVAAHTAIAKMAGIPPDVSRGLVKGESNEPKTAALIKLAGEISSKRGRPSDEAIDNFYRAGYGDAALAEVVAHVALNLYTNYFNHISEPKIDFPKV